MILKSFLDSYDFESFLFMIFLRNIPSNSLSGHTEETDLASVSLFLIAYKHFWRCSWFNGYSCWKWTQYHEFKSRTGQFAFYILLIFLGRYKSNYSPSSRGKIVRQTGLFNLGMATSLGEGKLWIRTCKAPLKIDIALHPTRAKEWVYTYIHISWRP